MRKVIFITLLLLFMASPVFANWVRNRYTQQWDYYENPMRTTVPTTPSTTCTAGEIALDNTTLYVCSPANTWSTVTTTPWAVTRTLVNWQATQVQWQGADVQI